MKTTVFAIIIIFTLASNSFAAVIDTSFDFSTIETPNFYIHFHQGLEKVAQKTAIFAEDAHVKLTKEFNWQPIEKTELVLIDNSDFTNGFATVLPYNTIYIQVVPPTLSSTLGEYEDWLKVVIMHEYTHIITSDSSRGYWNIVRKIVGKPIPGVDQLSFILFLTSAPPNTFLPRWWHEGIATYAETKYTGVGRGRSSYYDMVFRMAVADNNFPTVDQLNGDTPKWPAGNLPYMFGYKLQQYIADKYGKDALGKLNIAHAGRFPFFISSPPQEIADDKNYRDLYDDMIADLKRVQSERIANLSATPFTPLRTISKRGERLTNPRFSPDGEKIAFSRSDPHDHTKTIITDKSGSTVLAEFRRNYSDGSLCWSPDGKNIYFTQAEINNGFNVYQDLYRYDIAKDSIFRITHAERLGDLDISPDGSTFATVVSKSGSQNLVLLKNSKDSRDLKRITTYTQERVASPRWSPDASQISFTMTDNAGKSSIHLYDVASGKDQTLFSVNHVAEYPVWSKDGSFLFYISDETGIFNIFAYDLKSGKNIQVSHLLGGALQPDLSPDGLSVIFSSYDSHGFSIAQVAVDKDKVFENKYPKLQPIEEKIVLPLTRDTLLDGTSEVTTQKKSTPYSSFPTLLPHFWLPRISDDGSDQVALGVFTAGTDVLGYNSYSLTADYSYGRKRGYFDFNYQNDYFYPTLFLQGYAAPFLYANLHQKGDYYELNQGLTIGASVPLNFMESSYSVTAGYQLQDQRALSILDKNERFNGIKVFQGRQDNLFAGITFGNALKYPYSISSEEGRKISLLYRYFDTSLGSDTNLSKYSAEYQEYFRVPTTDLKHHVIYVRVAGALADRDSLSGQQAFQIGGIPSDLNLYSLRGFPERSVTGRYLAVGTLEYRAPIFFPMRGLGTFPAFAEKIHGAFFVDAGEAWDELNSFNSSDVKVGAGVEARIDVTLGYWLKVTPAIGVAHGFGTGGENQVYLTVYMDL